MGPISMYLKKLGYEVKDLIRWIKPSPMPRNIERRYVTDFEFIIWAVKGKGKWVFNKPKGNSYLRPEIKSPPPMGKKRLHPNHKPDFVIRELIETHTNEGDLIFDPFSGSGQISYTSNKMDRDFIACENNKKYYDISIERFNKENIRPIFNHLGNKYRIIDEIINKFPKTIDNFVDVFTGSGIVSLSYKGAINYYINDIDDTLINIIKYVKKTSSKKIISGIEDIVQKYNLIKINDKFVIKENYLKFRNEFNKNKHEFSNIDKQLQLLTLILFGFNHQIRFNSNGDFNIPAGKTSWGDHNKSKIYNFKNSIKNKNLRITNYDFEEFILSISNDRNFDIKSSIFYFDPPYFLSNATYNNLWTETKEEEMYSQIDYLIKKGAKIVISNVLFSKGKENIHLQNFIKRNKGVIKKEFLENVSYSNSNYQREENSIDREIILWN